jgi:hypothetical protein
MPMKNDINRTTALLSALVAFTVGLTTAQTSAASANISYDWQFSTSANPAPPESAVGGTGAALAAIAPGPFSGGWISNNAILGTAQGVWDLGSTGVITLANSAGLAGGSGQERLITVSVTQYQDGGIYGQLATVSVPGAALVSSATSVAGFTLIGQWTAAQTQWRAGAGTPVNSIVIAGVAGGSLVDEVSMASSFSGVVQPPQLTIQRVGPDNSQVEISWPASYSNMVLQSTSAIASPLGWAPVPDQGQVSGTVRVVTVDAAGTAQFYRLKQP